MTSRRHSRSESIGKRKDVFRGSAAAFAMFGFEALFEGGYDGGCQTFTRQSGDFRREQIGLWVFQVQALQNLPSVGRLPPSVRYRISTICLERNLETSISNVPTVPWRAWRTNPANSSGVKARRID
jgi:hypothetical protein